MTVDIICSICGFDHTAETCPERPAPAPRVHCHWCKKDMGPASTDPRISDNDECAECIAIQQSFNPESHQPHDPSVVFIRRCVECDRDFETPIARATVCHDCMFDVEPGNTF